MALLSLTIAATPLLAGFAVALWILAHRLDQGAAWLVAAGLAVPFGSLLLLGFEALEIQWHLTLSLSAQSGVLALGSVCLFYLAFKAQSRTKSGALDGDAHNRTGWFACTAIVAVSLLIGFYTGQEASGRPAFAWDAWQLWYPKGFRLYDVQGSLTFANQEGWLTAEPGQKVFFSNRPDHGLMIPAAIAWIAETYGAWDERVIGLLWPLYGTALIFLVGSMMMLLGVGSVWGISAALLIGLTPYIQVHMALPGYADLPVGMVLAALCLLGPMLLRERPVAGFAFGALALLALYHLKASSIVWISLLLIIALIAKALARMPVLLRIAVPLALLLMVVLAWLDLSFTLESVPAVQGSFAIGYNDNSLRVFTVLFLSINWGIGWWIASAALLIAILQRTGTVSLQWAFMAGALMIAAVSILLFTAKGTPDVFSTNINRIMLHVYPAACCMSLLSLSRTLDRTLGSPSYALSEPESIPTSRT